MGQRRVGWSDLEMKTDWQSVFGVGFCGALQIIKTNFGEPAMDRNDYVIEDGG